jgi:predicted Co/Zn/Cd cation transporter (cation efflux family)
METNDIGKYTIAFGVSLAVTSLLSAVLVVLKESNKNLLGWMAKATGHHWVTHGLIAVVVFLALGYGLAQINDKQGLRMDPNRIIALIVGAIIVSGLIIAGFYLFED